MKNRKVLLFVCDLVRRWQWADQETKLGCLRPGEPWLSAFLFSCLSGVRFTHHTLKVEGEGGRIRIIL